MFNKINKFVQKYIDNENKVKLINMTLDQAIQAIRKHDSLSYSLPQGVLIAKTFIAPIDEKLRDEFLNRYLNDKNDISMSHEAINYLYSNGDVCVYALYHDFNKFNQIAFSPLNDFIDTYIPKIKGELF